MLPAAVRSSTAFAQTNLQLWGNVTLDWVKSDRLTYEFDIEPKVLVNFGLREQVPKRRVVVRDLVRVESRNSLVHPRRQRDVIRPFPEPRRIPRAAQ
jgi:hypothetical protein